MHAHGNKTPTRAVPVTWAQPAGNVRPYVRRAPEDGTSEVTLLRSEIAVMRDEAAERDERIDQLQEEIAAHLVTIERLGREARKRGPYKKRAP